MKKLFVFFIVFSFINVFANTKETVKFSRCVDGDTMIVIKDGKETRVRFLAVDTPETVHPTKEVEAYGKNASEYTCNMITNAKKIVLEYDDGSTLYDKYNRLLAWVYVDDVFLQEKLIEVGYARVKYIYGKYAYTDHLYEVEEKAKEKKLGLWSDYTPVTYIVTFDNNGSKTKIKVNENELVEELEVDDKNFDGWYLNDKKFDFNTKITSNITLEAKYKESYTTWEIILIVGVIALYFYVNPKDAKKKLKKKLKMV